jgi:hypothetical protein
MAIERGGISHCLLFPGRGRWFFLADATAAEKKCYYGYSNPEDIYYFHGSTCNIPLVQAKGYQFSQTPTWILPG